MSYFKRIVTLISLISVTSLCFGQQEAYKLIAHRGGIVNDTIEENSKQAIQEAAKRGYWMVELDVRMTKDSVLIAHHDRDFNRYYGINKNVSEVDWATIQTFRTKQGNQVQKLEDLLTLCESLNLQVMIDNKIQGFHPKVFYLLLEMMKQHNLLEQAFMIGTDESTDFFRGKIKLSCTKDQILENMKRTNYSPDHYYLFGIPSKEDVSWALANDITPVGVINYHPRYADEKHYQELADKLKSIGVKYFQLDSRFDQYFINK